MLSLNKELHRAHHDRPQLNKGLLMHLLDCNQVTKT